MKSKEGSNRKRKKINFYFPNEEGNSHGKRKAICGTSYVGEKDHGESHFLGLRYLEKSALAMKRGTRVKKEHPNNNWKSSRLRSEEKERSSLGIVERQGEALVH